MVQHGSLINSSFLARLLYPTQGYVLVMSICPSVHQYVRTSVLSVKSFKIASKLKKYQLQTLYECTCLDVYKAFEMSLCVVTLTFNLGCQTIQPYLFLFCFVLYVSNWNSYWVWILFLP